MKFETKNGNMIVIPHVVTFDKPVALEDSSSPGSKTVFVGVQLQGVPKGSIFQVHVAAVMEKGVLDQEATDKAVEAVKKEAQTWFEKLCRAVDEYHKSAK